MERPEMRMIMNEMKLYNTLTKKVETFEPNEPGKVKMYTCGPTVYHFAHTLHTENFQLP